MQVNVIMSTVWVRSQGTEELSNALADPNLTEEPIGMVPLASQGCVLPHLYTTATSYWAGSVILLLKEKWHPSREGMDILPYRKDRAKKTI